MKLAIAGTGMISEEVLDTAARMGFSVTELCSTPRSEEKAQEWSRKYAIPAVYTDYAKMLREMKADVVYLGIPNILHHSYTRQALENGRNVIVEKPFTCSIREAEELIALAEEKGLFLFEAITTRYLSNYHKIRGWLDKIGPVRIVSCNFSQYSSRYDAFQKGIIAPVFDPEKCGGALMDLNLYNVQWIMGLFGVPKAVHYRANMEKGIDTSGILTMDYDGFQAVSIAAKDCGAPCNYTIQGTKGYILQTAPANGCLSVGYHLNDGTEEWISQEATPENYAKRLEPEFRFFAEQIQCGNTEKCYQELQLTKQVCRILEEARRSAGIRFPVDAK